MSKSSRLIGILGGTFDPIHCGHLAIAAAARDALGLERALFVPAGRPWLKAGQRVTEPAHRMAMARLAVAGRPGFEASSIEIDRPGPTYTVDTLDELRREMGVVGLRLILGMDSIREIRRWREPERLFDMCSIVAVSRPDSEDIDLDEFERIFPVARGRIVMIRGPMLSVSATDIRRRVAENRPISRLVPRPVERYIRDKGLYNR